MKNEIVKEIADLKEKLARLEDKVKLEDNEAKKVDIWKPKYNEDYYQIDGDGSICSYSNKNDDMDNSYIKIGNFYRTEKEAAFEAQCEKYTRLYRKYVEEHSEPLDWNDENQYKWFAYCYASNGNIIISTNKNICSPNICASNDQIIWDAIDFVGKDNFVKYVLRIKENNNV